MMKLLVKRLIFNVIKNDSLWSLLNSTVLSAGRYAERLRLQHKVIQDVCNDQTVRYGVFKGLKYPEGAIVTTRHLIAKLFGSYEKELHPILEKISNKDYTEIVNVGCAEGFYAVGFATTNQNAKVYAYDLNNIAIRMCNSMARLNNVDQRVITDSFCDAETLSSIPFTKKGLIISDCEGYEKELFTEKLVPILAKHDLLIEIHDLFDATISSYIRQRFENTHELTVVKSIDDDTKVQTHSCEELERYDLETRKRLLGESRIASMEWFFLTPR